MLAHSVLVNLKHKSSHLKHGRRKTNVSSAQLNQPRSLKQRSLGRGKRDSNTTQKMHQHLQGLASYGPSLKRGMTMLLVLLFSSPRRLDDCLHNAEDALICPLVVIFAHDAGSFAFSGYQRTIHKLLKGASKMF